MLMLQVSLSHNCGDLDEAIIDISEELHRVLYYIKLLFYQAKKVTLVRKL